MAPAPFCRQPLRIQGEILSDQRHSSNCSTRAALRVSVRVGMLGVSPEASPIKIPQGRHLSLHGKQIKTRSSFHVSCSFRQAPRPCSPSASRHSAVLQRVGLCTSNNGTASPACHGSTERHLAGKYGVSVSPRAVSLRLSQSYRVGSNRSSAHWATKSWALGEGLRQRAWLIVVTTPFRLRYLD